MERLMERIRELAKDGESFDDIFSRTTGWLESKAEHDPETTYTAKEVAELLNLLLDVKHDEAV